MHQSRQKLRLLGHIERCVNCPNTQFILLERAQTPYDILRGGENCVPKNVYLELELDEAAGATAGNGVRIVGDMFEKGTVLAKPKFGQRSK